MLWKIGQQVVCIVDVAPTDEHGNRQPQFNCVYTIRSFITDPVDGTLGITLEEIVNPRRPCYPDGHLGERAFGVENFRPVKPTSIESFTRLLAPGPKASTDA